MELFLPVVLLLPLLLIFMMNRRRQRDARSLQARLAVGQHVMTTAGLFGQIVDLDAETVHLEVAPGVRMRWARPAVARVVADPAAEPGESGDLGTSGATDRPS